MPRAEAVVSVIGNIGASQGLWLANRTTNVCGAVTGLTAAGSAGFGVNAVQMDPCDDRIWLGGINSNGNTAGQLNSVRINGTAAAGGVVVPGSFVQHALIPALTSIAAITFDDNGNPVVVGGIAPGGGVYRVDRCTPGAAAVLIGQVTSGTHNAICRDASGNLYIGMFTAGQVWKMNKNPDCSYGAPALLGTVPITSVSGLDWIPDATGGQIYITTFGVAGNAMFKMSATVGGVAVVASPTVAALNATEYDVVNGDFWSVTAGIDPDFVETMTPAGVNTQVCLLQAGSVGSPAGVDVSDCVRAETVIVPQCPARGTPICVSLGTCCNAGELAVIHLMAPVAVPIAVAPVGPNGRLSASFTLTLPPGFPPGALTFASACVGAAGLAVGSFSRWPAF